MSRKNLSFVLLAAFVAVGTCMLFNTANAAGWHGKKLLKKVGCHRCPSCECTLEAEMVDEEKTCFEVECKTICIPRIVFPWQKKKSHGSCDACDGRGCSSCVHNGARTRTIRVLKTEKYKCPKCEYTWTPIEKPCGGCDAPGCCDAGCDAGGCDSGFSTAPASTTYSMPQSEGMQPVEVEASQQLAPARIAQ